MKDLIEGIGIYWNRQDELTGFFEGGLHLVEAPKDISEPYVVLFLDELYSPLVWDAELNTYAVFFDIHTQGRDAQQLVDGFELIKSHFSDPDLSVDGWHLIKFLRIKATQPDRVDNKWALRVEYECILQEEESE